MNKLYFGDNLQVMRDAIPDNSIDLIATDPPFNSNRNYNMFFDSKAQTKAFSDTWVWDESSEQARENIRNQKTPQYENADRALRAIDLLLDNAVSGNGGAMRSYLTFMAARIVEMHRVMKNTGSVFLHCDTNASHYLKIIMDSVFDVLNFRNEIIWHYSNKLRKKSWRKFTCLTDTIYWYSKSDSFAFNSQYKIREHPRKYPKVKRINGEKVHLTDKSGKKLYVKSTETLIGNLWNIPLLSRSGERLGYPTQKPRELYERIVKSSSNENNIVLDPFCGCGTTIDAAQSLNRKWIGIDITFAALTPITKRLSERYNIYAGKDYDVSGFPTTIDECHSLIEQDKGLYNFETWAVLEFGLFPTKRSGDDGIDGNGQTHPYIRDNKEYRSKVLAEVKSGNFTLSNVRDFCHVMDRDNADFGIFICLKKKPTAKMREEANKMGYIETNNKRYNRLQFCHITDELFDTDSITNAVSLPQHIDYPYKAQKHYTDMQEQLF